MIEININNCNNIEQAKLKVFKDKLNIKYATSGNSKSMLATCIENNSNKTKLASPKKSGKKVEPGVTTSEPINNVLLFNDSYVNKMAFIESEVIPNSFEVYVKSDDYENKLLELNDQLKELKTKIMLDNDIKKMINTFSNVLNKLKLNTNGSIKANPFLKSILEREKVFSVPEGLDRFKSFLASNDHNIDWIDWKTKGSNFDGIDGCPFCARKLGKSYEKEKKIFTETFKKTSVKNLKEMLSFIKELSEFIIPNQYDVLEECIKASEDEDRIKHTLEKFLGELSYLQRKMDKVIHFNACDVKSENINNLEHVLQDLKISKSDLSVFASVKTLKIIKKVNEKLESLNILASELKQKNGTLVGLLKEPAETVEAIARDINEFLTHARINYEFIIYQESKSSIKAILKYKAKKGDRPEIVEMKKYLSKGDKNAFALILFMHNAISQGFDLIILDDPVASFDSNKKFAIINRLFKNSQKRSFYKKTVILLTHDFEPVIDFTFNSSSTENHFNTSFLKNINGTLVEVEITKSDIQSAVLLFKRNAKDKSIGIVNRIVFLRKYIEHTIADLQNNLVYGLLSSLVLAQAEPVNKKGTLYTKEEIAIATDSIRRWIPNFDYDVIFKTFFSKEKIKQLYSLETIPYLKVQLFKVFVELEGVREKLKDNSILKYVDKTFHIESDYLFYLDILKYNTVPMHILDCCDVILPKIR